MNGPVQLLPPATGATLLAAHPTIWRPCLTTTGHVNNQPPGDEMGKLGVHNA
ncbi:hypothetical protein [Dictyobacter halimunensis]|uniref:hypothetical protein n=1 Tax=Dictyobacter halimunensis TaxID=3026934 RepID=UPI0030C6B402